MINLRAKHAGVHKKGTFSTAKLLESVKRNPNYAKVGAVAMFIGVVRGETHKGEFVKRLELEAYDERADQILGKICQDLESRKGIFDVQIHHFTGEFERGEDLVYVSVAGGHRQNVFPALQEAVERYKKEAPIFKKEYVKDEKGTTRSYWVSEQEARQ